MEKSTLIRFSKEKKLIYVLKCTNLLVFRTSVNEP